MKRFERPNGRDTAPLYKNIPFPFLVFHVFDNCLYASGSRRVRTITLYVSNFSYNNVEHSVVISLKLLFLSETA